MVTPAGVLESFRLPGSGAGPSPDRMFIGSEGTLGIITEAWMRLRPRPTFRANTTARFADFYQAAECVRAIAQAQLYPANCRLLDADEALVNGGGRRHPLRAGAQLRVGGSSAGCDAAACARRSCARMAASTTRRRSGRGCAACGRRRPVARRLHPHALHPRGADAARDHRRDVRDGYHVGPLPRLPRAGQGARPSARSRR